jgi:hypothetical protein
VVIWRHISRTDDLAILLAPLQQGIGRAKLGVVKEEADEAVYWLEFFWKAGLGDPARVDHMVSEAKELRAMFSASCGTAQRNHRRRRGR